MPNEPVQMMLLGDAAEHAAVGIVVWNAERRYVAANPCACKLLGTTREALLDAPVGTMNRSEEAQAAIASLVANVPAQGTTPFTRSDGSAIELAWIVFPSTIAGLEHIVGFMWDKTTL
jgi:PAS domain S-box-containing protein